jgi:hypothetical protein
VYVQVTDNSLPYPQTAYANFVITAQPGGLAVETASLPSVVIGSPYQQALAATGGYLPWPALYTWSITGGVLPDGLSMNQSGVITGTPTVGGTFSFTVQVQDRWSPANTAAADLSITVITRLSVTTDSLPGGEVGQDYAQAVTAQGGVPPYEWSVMYGQLPPGLSLDASTGAISGTPAAPGSYQFTVRADDGGDPAQSATVDLTVVVGSSLTITTGSLPTLMATVSYNIPLNAASGTAPYAWSITAGALREGSA